MTVKTRVADYRLEAAFDQNTEGIFFIETSALDGTDGLSDSTTSYAFTASFDDITDDVVDAVTVVAGTDALAASVQAGSLTVDLLHPSDLSKWNPNNPASPLNAQSPGFVPMRPVRLRALVDGPAGSPLTTSGNEITDLMRTAALQGDGRAAPDSSFGIWEATTNQLTNGGFESGTTGWTNGSAGALTQDAARAKFGVKSGKITANGYAATRVALANIDLAVTAAIQQFSAWVYVPTAWGGTLPYLVARASATLSGNEITDTTRTAALAWGTTQLGGSVDAYASPDSSFGIWEAGTNLFQHGQADALGTSWIKDGATSTIALDATPGPFSPGSVKVTAPSAGHGINAQTATGLAAAAGTPAVGAIWFSGTAGHQYTAFLIWNNTDASSTSGAQIALTAGDGSRPSVVVAGKTWELVTPPKIAVVTGKTGDRITIRVDANAADVFWVVSAMCQAGAQCVTPYVATSGGSTATRAAARVQAPSSLLSAAQGWFAARIRTGFASTAPPASNADLFDWRTDANNRLHLRFNVTNSQWEAVSTVAGVETVAQVAAAFNTGDLRTLVMAWGAFGVAISLNGGAFVTVAAALPAPSAALFDIGSAAGASFLNGNVLWAGWGTGTLANADAASVGAIGNSDPDFVSAWGANAAVTAVWAADGKHFDISKPVQAANTRDAWQRIVCPYTPTEALTITHTIRSSTTVNGDTLNIDGVQLEQKSTATPYVETNGVAATRPAARVQAPSSLLAAAQGWVAMRVRMGVASSAGLSCACFNLSDGTANNRVSGRFNGATIELRDIAAGVAAETASVPLVYAAGDLVTVVFAWTAAGIKVSVNGAAFVAVNTRTVPAGMTTLDIGSLLGTGSWLDGDVLWAAFGTGAVSDRDAAAVYSIGGTDPNPADFADSTACTAAWSADTAAYTVPGGTSYGIFWGFIRRADWDSNTCECSLYCEDLLLWLSRTFPTIASTGPTTTGAAIGKILNAAGWDEPAFRKLDAGDVLTDFSLDGTKSALEAIQNLLTAERGTVYHRGDGVLVYEQRSGVRLRSSSWTVDDELTSQTSGIDVDSLYTRVTATDASGIPQVAENATAEAVYGRGDFPDIQSDYIVNAALLAADVLFEIQGGKPPITITVDNESDATELQILTSPLLSVFTVNETLGGTAGDFVVQRITHTIRSRYHGAEYLLQKKVGGREFDIETSALDGTDGLRY